MSSLTYIKPLKKNFKSNSILGREFLVKLCYAGPLSRRFMPREYATSLLYQDQARLCDHERELFIRSLALVLQGRRQRQ
jgi:hypothetical protein